MENWETNLAKATDPDTRDVVAAIGLVVNSKGDTVYHQASGRQSLEPDAPCVDPNSTVSLASTGKFLTHIAALQFVERGIITLDEPINKYIPEVEAFPRIIEDSDSRGFVLLPAEKRMTLRHLLLNTCGLTDHEQPLTRQYVASDTPKPSFPEGTSILVTNFCIPLSFEPGEGFYYGYAIRLTQLLVERLAGMRFVAYMQANIFDPLGMKSSTYTPRIVPEVWNRRLRMVERVDGKLVPFDDEQPGLTCSMSDVATLLADILAPKSKLLQPEFIDLLFSGQLEPGSAAWEDLRSNPDNYSFVAGKPTTPPALNWSMAGLVVEEHIPRTGLPKGTVVWEGWPNLLLFMNKEKGLAVFFATQLVPIWDEKAHQIQMEFVRDAWNMFG